MAREDRKPGKEVLRSVVKVYTVSDAPDYEQPWQTQGPVSSSGSGVIVKTKRGLRILTNGHVVENHVFTEVRRYGLSHKFVAEVEGVGHTCDLALLRVEDEEFFAGAHPIEIGGLPQLGDDISVLGYPIGGTRLSITRGVVSRIEMSSYAQSQRRLLAVQIDAAINAGNSGGPVVNGERLVGVAFQAYDEGQNIGYMIAGSVVRHFLKDMENGTFDGFPDLGLSTQTLESRSHRRSLGLTRATPGGVLVTGVSFEGSCWGILKPGDVLLEIDGVKVGADGGVRFRRGERLSYTYVVTRRHVGDHVAIRIWRKGRAKKLVIKLVPPRFLVPEDAYDVRPTYYVFAGLVFAPLSRDYLKTWGEDWPSEAPGDLLSLYEGGLRAADRTQIVVLQKVLADRTTQGYHDCSSMVIEQVDGHDIRDLSELIDRVEKGRGEFLRLETSEGYQIVIDREEAKRRSPGILRRYSVPVDRSVDLPPQS
jgi:S1-C subfamily serine protease